MVIWTHTWGVLSTQHTEELEKCMGSIVPSETVEKFNYEGLCKALEQLSDFEEKADSMGDLLCLLKANIGIVIGPCLSEYGAEAIYFDEGVIPEKKDNWSAFPAWARRERLQHGHY